MPPRPAVLVIAGTDSSGGAGLARDVQVLDELSADVLCAVTAVTAQSNRRVSRVHHVPAELVRAQIDAAFETRRPSAIKIGMLGTGATVAAVAEGVQGYETIPLVLDPVLAASSGGVLLDAAGCESMKRMLLPRAVLVTPNVIEAGVLLAEEPAADERELYAQAQRLLALGARAVLLKGGHSSGDEAIDWLAMPGCAPERIASPRIRVRLRGTGCALASAIAAHLATGVPLPEACRRAKDYVTRQLRAAAEQVRSH
ncbi:MAG TPA: bifunctional hydroxymethylpyrimidine kinase/phosphomethylpyrimidine kinase [Steroidobacteraceae bacterium]|nr:bifunctional hydroxymethylpyrimidine kinase/phosphomethylpyrimidine kinase [Steroidobacteraceae bacterium]